MESQSEVVWRRLLREGKLVWVGFCNPSQVYLEDEDGQVMVEAFLSRKLNGDRKAVKVRITMEVLRPKPEKEEAED